MKKQHLIIVLILALAGFITSIILAKIGFTVVVDPSVKSFCNINEAFNCDAVALSGYAAHFGIPNFLYGIGFYLLIIVISIFNLFSTKLNLKNFFVYLFWLSLVSVLVSIYLFFVSHFIIESFCILCMIIYGINILLLLVTFMAENWSIKKLFKTLVDDIVLYFSSSLRTIVFIILSGITITLLLYFNANPLLGEARPPDKIQIEIDHSKATPHRLVAGTSDVPLITAIIFTDYECHFCGKAAEEFKKVMSNNPDIRLIFKDYPLDQSCNQRLPRPFHHNSCKASLHARCAAEQGKFWEYHDLLFENQGQYNDETLIKYAQDLELDVDKFLKCTTSKKYLDSIITDIDEGVALGVSGTPTFFIESKKLEGYRTAEDYQAFIDEIKDDIKRQQEEYEKRKQEYLKQQAKEAKKKNN
jgi:protein-disulfide isomerase